MTRKHPHAGYWVKVNRSDHHFRELHAATIKLRERQFYEVIGETNPQTGQVTLTVSMPRSKGPKSIVPTYFDGIDAKIKRADKHGFELKDVVDRFKQSEPYTLFSYCDLESRNELFAVHVNAEPPLEAAAIAGDLINNLRTALDYLMCELYRVNGVEPSEWTFFPISRTPDKFKAKIGGIEKTIGKKAVKLIEATEPYKGGAGDGLWQLHELNRRDKHRLLMTVGSSYEEFAFKPSDKRFAGAPFIHIKPKGGRVYPLKEGTVLFSKPALVDMDLKFGFNVVLDEPGVIDGELLLPTLFQFFNLVKGTVEPFRPLLT